MLAYWPSEKALGEAPIKDLHVCFQTIFPFKLLPSLLSFLFLFFGFCCCCCYCLGGDRNPACLRGIWEPCEVIFQKRDPGESHAKQAWGRDSKDAWLQQGSERWGNHFWHTGQDGEGKSSTAYLKALRFVQTTRMVSKLQGIDQAKFLWPQWYLVPSLLNQSGMSWCVNWTVPILGLLDLPGWLTQSMLPLFLYKFYRGLSLVKLEIVISSIVSRTPSLYFYLNK